MYFFTKEQNATLCSYADSRPPANVSMNMASCVWAVWLNPAASSFPLSFQYSRALYSPGSGRLCKWDRSSRGPPEMQNSRIIAPNSEPVCVRSLCRYAKGCELLRVIRPINECIWRCYVVRNFPFFNLIKVFLTLREITARELNDTLFLSSSQPPYKFTPFLMTKN